MLGSKTRPRKTLDDLYRLPPETRAELIEGEIYMSPSPSLRHQRICKRIHNALGAFVEGRGFGEVFFAPLDVILPSGEAVQPDNIVVLRANRGILKDRVRGAPDLLVEVVSPDNPERDRIVKRDLYARNGVREYWIVDDATDSIELLVLRDGRWEPAGYFRSGDTLQSPILPGFSLPVAETFAE